MKKYSPTETRKEALIHVMDAKKKYKKDNDLLSLIQSNIDIWNDCKEIKDNWAKLTTAFEPIKKTNNFTDEQLKVAIDQVARLYRTHTLIEDKDKITNYLCNDKDYIKKAITGTLIPVTVDDINDDYPGVRSIRSLLSKIFCLLNEDVYPIYDSIAKKTLIDLTGKRVRCFDVSYTRYVYLIDKFKTDKGLSNHSHRAFDKFLWLYGQTL